VRRIVGGNADEVTLVLRAAHAAPNGVTPSDIDVAGVHHFFTGAQPISYEGLGFVDRFSGIQPSAATVTAVGGALPVNPTGGLEGSEGPDHGC
jgi:acetyl-CoA C-acetyltransferase